MRLTISGAAAALLLASIAPAGAQAPPAPPMMMGMTDWSGFYAGLNAGGGIASTHYNFKPSGSPTTFHSGTFEPGGLLGGGTFGYNYILSPGWILGAEGDIDADGISGAKNCATSLYNCHAGSSYLATARARLGWAPGAGPMMWFVTGGGAFGDVNYSTTPGGTVAATHVPSSGGDKAGWTVGGGFEYMFAPQWSVKVEYRYVDLASNYTANIGLAGFNFHFNAPPPPPPAPAAVPAPPPAAPKVFIVFFDWDKDTITPEGHAIIQQAADAYKAGAPVQIQVTGYTDRSGSPGYNQRLSERRANNVARALAALGVPRDQMIVAGRGENDNRVPTAPGVREPQNRRVEIVEP